MNKQSNIYTIIYIVVLAVVVGAALAFAALSLKPLQVDNANADKMKQILASVHITPDKADVISDFNKYVTEQYIVNSQGERIEGNAFDVNVAEQSKRPVDQREMPVYVCSLSPNDGSTFCPCTVPDYGVPSGATSRSTATDRPYTEPTSHTRVKLPDLEPKSKSPRSATSSTTCTYSRKDDFCP